MPSENFQPLFVFTADLHLQPNAWVKHPTLRGDAYSSLQQIVDYCFYGNLNLFVGGDIYDRKRPDPESIYIFNTQARRLFDAGLVLTFLQGDHDYQSTVPWPNVSNCVAHMHRSSFQAGPFRCYAFDWTPAERLQQELDQIPEGTDILMCHQSWSEVMGIGATEGSIAKIPHVRYVLTGDYHVNMTKTVVAEDGREILVMSPGSTAMQSVDERYEKWFLVIGIEDGELAAYREPLLTRMRFDLRYNTEQELDRDLDVGVIQQFANDPRLVGLPDDIRKPILRVIFNDEIPDALERIQHVAGENFHVFPVARRLTEEVVVELDEAPEGAFETVLDACRRLAPDQTTYDIARRLLQAACRHDKADGDILRETLEAIRNEHRQRQKSVQ